MVCPAGVGLCMACHRLPWHPLAASLALEQGASSDGDDWRTARERVNHIQHPSSATNLVRVWLMTL